MSNFEQTPAEPMPIPDSVIPPFTLLLEPVKNWNEFNKQNLALFRVAKARTSEPVGSAHNTRMALAAIRIHGPGHVEAELFEYHSADESDNPYRQKAVTFSNPDRITSGDGWHDDIKLLGGTVLVAALGRFAAAMTETTTY